MSQWIVTRDLIFDPIFDEKSCVGVKSYNFKKDVKMPFRFKLYDDDGILYYEGRSSNESFDPLDAFGMPYSGCTEIKYAFGRNKFKTL